MNKENKGSSIPDCRNESPIKSVHDNENREGDEVFVRKKK